METAIAFGYGNWHAIDHRRAFLTFDILAGHSMVQVLPTRRASGWARRNSTVQASSWAGSAPNGAWMSMRRVDLRPWSSTAERMYVAWCCWRVILRASFVQGSGRHLRRCWRRWRRLWKGLRSVGPERLAVAAGRVAVGSR